MTGGGAGPWITVAIQGQNMAEAGAGGCMIGRRLVTGRAVEGGKKSTKRTNWHCGRDGLAGERDDDTDTSDG